MTKSPRRSASPEEQPQQRRAGPNKGRNLMKWDLAADQLLLLAVETVTGNDGTKVDWNAVGKQIKPKVTGEAIKQLLSKVRKNRELIGAPVPDKIDRKAGTSRKNNTLTAAEMAASTVKNLDLVSMPLPRTPRRAAPVQAKSPAPPKIVKDIGKRKNTADSPLSGGTSKSAKSAKVKKESSPGSGSSTGHGRKKGAFRPSNFDLTPESEKNFYATAAQAQLPLRRNLREVPQKNYTEIVEDEALEDGDKDDEYEDMDADHEEDVEVSNNVKQEQVQHTSVVGDVGYTSTGDFGTSYAAVDGRGRDFGSMQVSFGGPSVGFPPRGDNGVGYSSTGGNGYNNPSVVITPGGLGLSHTTSAGYASGGVTPAGFAPRNDSVMDISNTGFMGQEFDFSGGFNFSGPNFGASPPPMSPLPALPTLAPTSTGTRPNGSFSSMVTVTNEDQAKSISNTPTQSRQNSQTENISANTDLRLAIGFQTNDFINPEFASTGDAQLNWAGASPIDTSNFVNGQISDPFVEYGAASGATFSQHGYNPSFDSLMD